MDDIERTELWTVRSVIRKHAATDPAEAAHHIIALEDEVTALRRRLGGLERFRAALQDLVEGNVFGYDSAEDFARAVLAGER